MLAVKAAFDGRFQMLSFQLFNACLMLALHARFQCSLSDARLERERERALAADTPKEGFSRASATALLSTPSMAAYVDDCKHVDITKQTLRVYRVDAELIGGVMHGRKKQTIEIPVKDVASLRVYTGILAPSMTCYIDVVFKDPKVHAQRCYLICGHPAAKLTTFEARLAGIAVTSELP
jgi:hypothetical protein